jgi:hypothetical protein
LSTKVPQWAGVNRFHPRAAGWHRRLGSGVLSGSLAFLRSAGESCFVQKSGQEVVCGCILVLVVLLFVFVTTRPGQTVNAGLSYPGATVELGKKVMKALEITLNE